jgi:hypothetical protein
MEGGAAHRSSARARGWGGALGHGSSMQLVRDRERDNCGVMLTSGKGRRQGVRIEPVMLGNVGGQHTLLGAAYR